MAPGEPVLGWAIFMAIVGRYALELTLARRHTRALLAAGGRLWPRDVTRFMVLVHTASMTGIALERWFGARIGGVASLVGGVVLLAATAGRVWVLTTLGKRWTIRVLTIPGEAPVQRGPYRWLRHPNYAVVLAEVVSIPVLFHAWWTLALGTVPHVAALALRIRCENRAWRESARGTAPPA